MGAFFLLRINDHMQYLKRIKATLDGGGDFRGTDHHSCKLGLWMDGAGRSEAVEAGAAAVALFDSLHDPHARFHAASGRALQHHVVGHQAEREQEVTEMHRLSAQLVDLLLRLDGMGKGT